MDKHFGAIILAAGLSSRMGKPKMVLPWKQSTIIQTVVGEVLAADIETICVVTGGSRELVEITLRNEPVQFVYNPLFEDGSMLHSVQAGLHSLMQTNIGVALIVLGDQPFIQRTTIRAVVNEFMTREEKIIFPSYAMKRGHPWLVVRELWNELLEVKEPETLRSFTQKHVRDIAYVNIDNDSIIRDIDTIEEYEKLKPK